MLGGALVVKCVLCMIWFKRGVYTCIHVEHLNITLSLKPYQTTRSTTDSTHEKLGIGFPSSLCGTLPESQHLPHSGFDIGFECPDCPD